MAKDLILIGGGGHCKAVIDIAETAGFNIIGILDRPEEVGKQVFDYRIIGVDDDICRYVDKAEFMITVGFIKNPALRIKLFNKVKDAGGKLATIISPIAYVSRYATIGEGTIVMHKATICAEAKIGCNCIINTMVDVDHGAQIGNFTHLSVNVLVAGEAKIGERCFCGIGSIISNQIVIVSDVILGAGALVIKNIVESGIYIGSPSKLYSK